MARPLDGLRVLDRTDGCGELCGRLLADLGADVVKVGPASADLSWRYRNWNKRLVDDGAALLAGADVVLHSSLDVVEPAHARQVVCAITWFGQTGPCAEWPGNDDVCVGMSGWLSQSGVLEKPPLLMPGHVASDAASATAAWAVLASLRSGRPQRLDVSAFEAVTQIDTWSLVNASTGADRRVRGGPQMYPAIATRDGTVKVVVMSLKQWRAVFTWLGEPEELADPAFDQMLTRIMRRDEINAVLTRFLATMSTQEASEEAQRRGIVITPINGPADLLADAHLAARGAFADVGGGRAPSGFWEIDGERMGFRVEAAPATGVEWTPRPAPAAPREGAPLAGLRVLDFGHGGVGVQCGRLFADHGAEVIKIESRGHPDFMRLMGANGTSPSFASSSRSKLGFGVDLKSDEGRDLVRRLAAQADVIIENNSAGTMDALGLGWDDLRAVNPDLVYLSSQLLGSRGPRAGWSGYGPSVQAYGGLLSLWAFDDGDGWPGSPSNHPDLLVGHLLAVLGLAMLHAGRGGHGELAQAEAVLGTLGDVVWAESLAPGSVRPQGNARSQVVRCAGEEEWLVATTDEDLSWCATAAPDDAAAQLRARDIPAARMAYAPDLLTDPQLVARGFLDPLDQPDIGPLVLDRQSYVASDLPLPPQRPAPRLGEHTRPACTTLLGLTDAEVDDLIERGVLES